MQRERVRAAIPIATLHCSQLLSTHTHRLLRNAGHGPDVGRRARALKRNGTGLPISELLEQRNAADPALVDGRSSRKISGRQGAGCDCEDWVHTGRRARATRCVCVRLSLRGVRAGGPLCNPVCSCRRPGCGRIAVPRRFCAGVNALYGLWSMCSIVASLQYKVQ